MIQVKFLLREESNVELDNIINKKLWDTRTTNKDWQEWLY